MNTIFCNLAEEVEIPDGSIISKTLLQADHLKVVLFGFAAGQELSEHTASVPAVLQFVDGEADVTVDEQRVVARANTFIHMPAKVPHSITAKTPTRMLLLMFKAAK